MSGQIQNYYLRQRGHLIVVIRPFVCLSATLRNKHPNTRICMKFSGKVGNGPMNNRLNFGGDPVTDPDTDSDPGKTCLGGLYIAFMCTV